MREFLLITIFLTTFLFPQSKLSWFFSDIENKELLSVEIKEQINPELEAMTSSFNKFFKEKLLSENYRYISARTFDNDGYTSHLLSLNNPTQAEANYLRSMYTQKSYSTGTKMRGISLNKLIKKESPTWKEVINYVGGYAQLAESEIDKSNLKDFELSTTLESIHFVEDSEKIDVTIKFSGNQRALDYYEIEDTKLNLMGSFKTPELTYIDIHTIEKGKLDIMFVIDNASLKTIPKNLKLGINQVFGDDIDIIVNQAKKIDSIISQMVNDIITNDYYNNMEHVKLARIEEEKRRKAEQERLEAEEIRKQEIRAAEMVEKSQKEKAAKDLELRKEELIVSYFDWVRNNEENFNIIRSYNRKFFEEEVKPSPNNRIFFADDGTSNFGTNYYKEQFSDVEKLKNNSGKKINTKDYLLIGSNLSFWLKLELKELEALFENDYKKLEEALEKEDIKTMFNELLDNDLRLELLEFFKENSQKSSNAPGWDEYRKNKDRKAAGISADRMKKINDNLKKDNWKYIIEANIYRTKAGQALWMELGFPYITKDGSFSKTELRAYLGNFVHALK